MKSFTSSKSLILSLMISFCLTVGSGALQAAIIYVNPLAGGANNGTSWIDAFIDLQPALASAVSGDEIWVARGVYIPSVEVDVDASGGSDIRERTFQIPSGVQLYGGFVGGEGDVSERNWVSNLTVLSGDLGMDDFNLDMDEIAGTPDDIVGDNAYHVVFTQNVSASTRLDGFAVTAGYAGNFMPLGFSPNREGGGWLDLDGVAPNSSSPGIYNCRFEGNFAESRGGAIKMGSFQPGTFEPVIENCRFSGNVAVRSGGAIALIGDAAEVENCEFIFNRTTNVSGSETGPGSGGAAYLISSNSSFNSCIFQLNRATGNPTGPFEGGGGGAVYINQGVVSTDNLGASLVSFINCGFFENRAEGNTDAWGGAVVNYSDGGNLTVNYTGCVFSDNFASDDGGAVAHFARVISPPMALPPILQANYTNCTFSDNAAFDDAGALYMDGTTFMGTQILSTEIENSILYSNASFLGENEITTDANSLISYSLIDGSGGSGGGWNAAFGTDGGNNIDTDPMFSNPADPNGADNTFATADDGLFPLAGSPVIGAGNNAASGLAGIATDFIGEMRVQGATVDMGAYEQSGGGAFCGALPVSVRNKDIGNTGGYVGTTCYDMGTYKIDASGSDIWGKKDGFHFVYKELSGNGEIIARVDDIGMNSSWDIAGVMMRENLAVNSKNVLMGVSAQGHAFFQRRKLTGGYTALLPAGNGRQPKWVKIIRFRNFFAGFKSNNGSNWSLTGLFYIPMSSKIFVGIATSTHVAGTPNSYEVSNFSVNGVSYKKAPFEESQLTELEDKAGPRDMSHSLLSGHFRVYPNPAKTYTNIELLSELDDEVVIEMVDMQGRLVRQIYEGETKSGHLYSFNLDRETLPNAMYAIRVKGKLTQQIRYLVLMD